MLEILTPQRRPPTPYCENHDHPLSRRAVLRSKGVSDENMTDTEVSDYLVSLMVQHVAPNIGDLAICSLGRRGRITRIETRPDGRKLYKGVTIGRNPGRSWQSINPAIVRKACH